MSRWLIASLLVSAATSAAGAQDHERRVLYVPLERAAVDADLPVLDALAAAPNVGAVARCLATLEQLHAHHCAGDDALACLRQLGEEAGADVVVVRRASRERVSLIAIDRQKTIRRTRLAPAALALHLGDAASWLVTGRVSLPRSEGVRYPSDEPQAPPLVRWTRFRRYVTRDGLSLLDLLREAGRPIGLEEDLQLAAAPRYDGPFVSVRTDLE